MPTKTPTPMQTVSQTPIQADISIVGAGMVGSAVACGLAAAGYSVMVIDQTEPADFLAEATPDIRVSALSYASELFLTQLGAWESILAMRSCPYRQLAVWEKLISPLTGSAVQSRLNKTLFDAKQVNKPYLGHIVENNVTQLALHAAMQTHSTIQTLYGAKVSQLQVKTDQATLTLSNGQQVQSKLVIGADGAMSKVRELAHIGLSADQYEQQAMVITVAHEAPAQDITWQAFTATGPMAYLPLPSVNGQHYGSLVWYNLPDNLDALMVLNDEALATKIQRAFPSELPTLNHIIARGRFPLTKRHAQQYVKPRITLVGDAAHTINPLAGQGVNLGFKDAASLIEILSIAKTLPLDPGDLKLLRQYEHTRRPANAQMMLLMDMFYHTFSNELAPLKAVRNLGLHFANHVPWAKTKVLKYAMGLS